MCLDTLGKDENEKIDLFISSCENRTTMNQYFSLTNTNQLRREETCAISTSSNQVTLVSCLLANSEQRWIHEKVKFLVFNRWMIVDKFIVERCNFASAKSTLSRY